MKSIRKVRALYSIWIINVTCVNANPNVYGISNFSANASTPLTVKSAGIDESFTVTVYVIYHRKDT